MLWTIQCVRGPRVALQIIEVDLEEDCLLGLADDETMGKQIQPKKHGNRWRIRPVDEFGRRRYLSFETKEQAMQALREFQLQFELNKKKGPTSHAAKPETVSDLFDYWLEYRTPLKRNPIDDISIINSRLRPKFGKLKLVDLNVAVVDSYRIEQRHLSPKTISNHLTLLISMLRLAKDMGWVRDVPNIKKPRLPKNPSDYGFLRNQDEVRRFLVAAAMEERSVSMLYFTAVNTGMRAGELAGLRKTDIDFPNRIITVQRSFNNPTKTDEIRRVPILDGLLPQLKQWHLENPLPLMFPNQHGNMHGPSSRIFQEILHRILDRAGFPRGGRRSKHYIRFHDLRHTFASHWMMNGGDIFKLQRVLGHKSQDMTQRYSHLSPEAFQGDYGRLNFEIPQSSGRLIHLHQERAMDFEEFFPPAK